MIRHIIAAVAVILAVWASVYMWKLDKEVNKLAKIHDIIEKTKDVKVKKTVIKKTKPKVVKVTKSVKEQDDEIARKLKALKDKAGNLAAFKVSPLYKQKCASCHGNIGEGIIGPKLLGKSKDYILSSLKDFKSGKRKNYVMYGLLGNMTDKQLEELATEISTFKAKLDAVQK